MGDRYDFQMISLNARGLVDHKKRTSVFNWLAKKKIDIIFLQETHSNLQSEQKWKNEWRGIVHMSHGTSNSRGCMIMFKRDLDVKILNVKCDVDGRYIIVNCEIMDDMFTLVNIYAPNTEDKQVKFINDLENTLTQLGYSSEQNFILGGDWNIVRDPSVDKQGGTFNKKQKSVDQMDLLMNNFSLNDSWRIKNPLERRYTWRQKTPLIQCRLDYWVISDSLFDNITHIDTIPSIQSDHSAIILKLKHIPEGKKGPGLWKFNNGLLDDETFTQGLRSKLNEWKDEYDFDDKRIKWEIIKYEIRKYCIAFSKKRSKQKKERIKELENELMILDRNIKDENDNKRYHNIKDEMLTLEKEKVKGLIIRSRSQWFEEGEKSTKYFFNLEKANAIKKHIRKLKVGDGTIVTDPTDILEEQRQFYQKLLSSQVQTSDNKHPEFFNSDIPTLSEDMKLECEGQITILECEQVLKTLKKNKSPGNDGLPFEFYDKFWDDLKTVIVDSFNYAFEYGELSSSQKQAVISLLEKKGKDRLFLKNWRPISLLNVDYKLASKVIAQRIRKTLPSLIHYNQSGFIEKRYIGDTIRTILDIMDYMDEYDEAGLMMMVDFEKAYDSLEWDFMIKVLQHFNFGPDLIKWIKTF